MTMVEDDPGTPLVLSVRSLSITAAGRTVPLSIPPVVRDSLLTGQWDATGLLLSEFEDVRLVASRLPYLKGF